MYIKVIVNSSIIDEAALHKWSLCSKILHIVFISHYNVKELVAITSMKRKISNTKNVTSLLSQAL